MDTYNLGTKGEEIARDYLVSQGYQILEEQWRYNKAEIDLICRHEDILVFVEVKARASKYYGLPEEFVTQKKQRLITAAASAYMQKVNHDWAIRFDIVGVVVPPVGNHKVHHFKDAFFLGL